MVPLEIDGLSNEHRETNSKVIRAPTNHKRNKQRDEPEFPAITYSRFSRDVTVAMLVYRTIAKKVFWEFDSIIMQNLSDILPLFCTPTWPSHHVSEKQKVLVYITLFMPNTTSNLATERKCVQI